MTRPTTRPTRSRTGDAARLDGPDMDADFVRLPDLAARRLGGAVVAANDDFFADRAALVMPGPVQPRTEFGYRGKVYDGWETRRRREPGSDHAIVRLGIPGIVHGVVVDTSYFRGNYPPEISVEATALEDYPGEAELAAAEWETIVPRSPAKGDRANVYDVQSSHRWTHVRLTIHPDGGVARFRVHGEAVVDPRLLHGTVDLAAQDRGGLVMSCSDMFFSSPANLLLPGPARNMGEGWETARRRDSGNDWVIVKLAGASRLRDIEFDTSHFVGNAPGQVQISGARIEGDVPAEALASRLWTPLVHRRIVRPDTPHRFQIGQGAGVVTHLKIDIFPDGGFARLRANGELLESEVERKAAAWLDALPPMHLRDALTGANLDPALIRGALAAAGNPTSRWAQELLDAFAPRRL
ncbi:allantoicase [Pseudonocardia oroxyli]|uniref:Probable allantoicase n=1 Tax=Pseudonocardia oroxyli TaxID=366584 RepID=A0A1G7T303_PSEOR|nr:allantoicase [Pseudonocardia oroxyli]SDG29706.1 allantoicase [Pseudonocardia oroxyli]